MKKFDVGQALQLLANFGVIAGIVFLGVELRQNNELMAQQQRYNRLLMATGTNDLILENPHVAALTVKSGQGLEALTAIELRQVLALEMRVLRSQEWSFLELPRDELLVTQWKDISKRESWRLVWARINPDLDPEFVLFMEENVIDQ
jgi:hypothetical protein